MADFIDAPPAPVEVPAAEASAPLVKSKVQKVKKAVANATKGKKIVFAASKTKSGNPPYATMVTKAIMELKEKKSSSRQSIMKYLQGNYKVDAANSSPMMNKTLKKMTTDGRLVAGAQAGRSGAGCYKVSAEEKMRIRQVEKAAAKKLVAADKKKVPVVKKTVKKPATVTGLKKKSAKKSAAGKKVVVKKSGTKKVGAKSMKKVAKASTGAKMKKGTAKPKKVDKKVAKKAKK